MYDLNLLRRINSIRSVMMSIEMALKTVSYRNLTWLLFLQSYKFWWLSRCMYRVLRSAVHPVRLFSDVAVLSFPHTRIVQELIRVSNESDS